LKKEGNQYSKGKSYQRGDHKKDCPGHGYAEKKKPGFHRLHILQNDNDTQYGQYGNADHFKTVHDSAPSNIFFQQIRSNPHISR